MAGRFLTKCVMVAAFALTASSAVAGAGAPVEVGAGHAVLLLLDKPARQVIIGDPTVADVSVESPTRVVVFGKQVGSTSLMVLDGSHQAMLDAAIVVHAGGVGSVTVTYGAGKDVKSGGLNAVFSCATTCVRAAEKAAGGAPAPAAPAAPAAAAPPK
ncbi:MAG: pilus assembly protein N-terminal domain-containing protein [Rhodospirillaceae bacterium]|nr:pilus assembly protein N-terminal domain-containing protein [Rhodospirillales bacterium]